MEASSVAHTIYQRVFGLLSTVWIFFCVCSTSSYVSESTWLVRYGGVIQAIVCSRLALYKSWVYFMRGGWGYGDEIGTLSYERKADVSTVAGSLFIGCSRSGENHFGQHWQHHGQSIVRFHGLLTCSCCRQMKYCLFQMHFKHFVKLNTFTRPFFG